MTRAIFSFFFSLRSSFGGAEVEQGQRIVLFIVHDVLVTHFWQDFSDGLKVQTPLHELVIMGTSRGRHVTRSRTDCLSWYLLVPTIPMFISHLHK